MELGLVLSTSSSPPDDLRLAVARWRVRSGLRFDAVLASLGLLVAVAMLVVGVGRRAAEASLARSEAQLAALRVGSVAPEDNAAPLWREAAAALVASEVVTEGGIALELVADPYDEVHRPLTRAWLAANDAALELCRAAASRPACDWGLPPVTPLDLGWVMPAFEVRELRPLLRAQCLASAGEGRWMEVEQGVRVLMALAEDLRGPLLIDGLMELGHSAQAAYAITAALAMPGSDPDLEALRALERLAAEALASRPPFAPVIVGEATFAAAAIDYSGSGRLSESLFDHYGENLSALLISDPAAVEGSDLPTSLCWYSALWGSDRAFLDAAAARLVAAARELDTGRIALPDVQAMASVTTEIARTPRMLRMHSMEAFATYESAITKPAVTLATWRMTWIALALTRRAKETGRWPDDLESLGLPADVLENPLVARGERYSLEPGPMGSLRVKYRTEDQQTLAWIDVYFPGTSERPTPEEE